MTVAAADSTDSQLVAAWRGGDETAAALLVRRHAEVLGRYLVSRGATSADLDDLLQDVFFRAFRGIDGWRGDAPFRGWLFRIAANLVRDGFRRGGGRVFVELLDGDQADGADPGGELEADETAARLRDGMATLSPMQREVFLLRVEQGLDYQEIAAALQTTPGAARVHYHNAVKRLKERLQ